MNPPYVTTTNVVYQPLPTQTVVYQQPAVYQPHVVYQLPYVVTYPQPTVYQQQQPVYPQQTVYQQPIVYQQPNQMVYTQTTYPTGWPPQYVHSLH